MRSVFVFVAAIGIVACTADVTVRKQSIDSRVDLACGELASLCQSSGKGCDAGTAFCGPLRPQFEQSFANEDTCKAGCGSDLTCVHQCKDERTQQVRAVLAASDLNGDGVVGDGVDACASLTELCTSTSNACPANEFFCTIAAAPAPSPCATELDECKATCAKRDRACRGGCRADYRACLEGGTTMPDAGVPMMSWNLTYGTTAGSTGTGTISLNPKGTSCGANCSTYTDGTMVTLTATPSTGSTFGGWTGCNSMTNTCTVTMTAAMTVTAKFTLATTARTYTKDIAPVTTGFCNGCHGGGGAPGNYQTDSYSALFGNGSDNTPNIIKGDATSKFVVYMKNGHKNVLNRYPGFDTVANDWVVLNNAAQ